MEQIRSDVKNVNILSLFLQETFSYYKVLKKVFIFMIHLVSNFFTDYD